MSDCFPRYFQTSFTQVSKIMGSTATPTTIPPIFGKLIVLTEQQNTTGDVTGYAVANNFGLPIMIPPPMPTSDALEILQAPKPLLKFLTSLLTGPTWNDW